ncbi:MAG: RNHCP domain-containing protein [Candidatus Andersenbacteria bacterium]
MGFIVINEQFNCESCGTHVPKAQSTCRNHCMKCLVSKHVDDNIPGDRATSCHGLMDAIAIEGSDPEKLDIIHQCRTCGKIQRNKKAPDDNQDAIFALMGSR